jgi:hypothetical protein
MHMIPTCLRPRLCPPTVFIVASHVRRHNGTIRVTDIGVDTLVRQGSNNSSCIPSNWMCKAPEELEWGYRTKQTNVYSFVVTMYPYEIYLFNFTVN